jgi:hypothetical protein
MVEGFNSCWVESPTGPLQLHYKEGMELEIEKIEWMVLGPNIFSPGYEGVATRNMMCDYPECDALLAVLFPSDEDHDISISATKHQSEQELQEIVAERRKSIASLTIGIGWSVLPVSNGVRDICPSCTEDILNGEKDGSRITDGIPPGEVELDYTKHIQKRGEGWERLG